MPAGTYQLSSFRFGYLAHVLRRLALMQYKIGKKCHCLATAQLTLCALNNCTPSATFFHNLSDNMRMRYFGAYASPTKADSAIFCILLRDLCHLIHDILSLFRALRIRIRIQQTRKMINVAAGKSQ